MRIALVQHDIAWEDPEANFERLAPRIASAAEGGARLVVLTEMFSTGFSMATERTAEPSDGPSVTFLVEQATRYGVWVGGSLPERPEGADLPFNTFVLAGPDGSTSRYRKIHPFSYSGEHEHFSAGSDFLTADVEGVKVTPFICYDLRFADEFWAAGPRTDLFVVPANWPDSRRDHWMALLRARAIENQCYVAGVNRVGEGGGLRYAGDSLVVDPRGGIVAAAGAGETIVYAEVAPEAVRRTREEFPFLADRRS